jgi:DNA polymerase (family 10)
VPGNEDGGNQEVGALLHDVATALQIKGEDRFQVAAYEAAAGGIAHTPVPIRDLWRAGRLTEIPGVGPSIAGHLDEWFRTGRSTRFDEALAGIPDVMFELVRIPGVGPATAGKLVAAGVEDLDDLERKLARGDLAATKLGAKTLERIARGLAELNRRPDRMLLPTAIASVRPLLQELQGLPSLVRADVAGSVRRRRATAANIDLAVAATDPAAVAARLAALSGVDSAGPLDIPGAPLGPSLAGVTLVLHNGRRARALCAPPDRYGALLQWLTGAAAHNVILGRRAAERGLTLGPDGVRDEARTIIPTPTEEDVYRLLAMATPPPELREGAGEVEAAAAGSLPRLVTAADIRGDCHSHTAWSDGRDSAEEMLAAARALGREYLVITDHSYPNLGYARRLVDLTEAQRAHQDIRLINGLEVNITVEGGLQVPDEILAAHQFCLASIHTGFRQPRETVTRRLLAALAHPLINGIAHPTGRLLLRREGVDADWEAVFDACLRYDKFLEIDGPPDRLDLPDDLVREAVRRGVKLTIDSDAHAAAELGNLLWGIDVARRGWATPTTILNTLPYAEFTRAAHVRA